MKLQLFAMLVACSTMVAHASEMQDREAITAEFKTAFERSDFAAIEARYARALATNERLASGVFVSGRIVRQMAWQAPPGPGPKGADAYFNPIEDKARAWTTQYPKSVLAAMALSHVYVDHGYAYRGTGWANRVPAEDFAKFQHYVGLAQKALLARADTGQADPNWNWQLLIVARYAQWPEDKYFALAQSALDTFPGYYDIYFEVGDRLLPQWGGSLEQFAAFAEQAAERTKATEGRGMYARIYWNSYSMFGAEKLSRGELDWPKIRAGFDDIVKHYPDPWNLNYFARFACDAGDKGTTKRVLDLVGDKVEPAAWANRGAYVRCKNLAAE